jgi:hypothetical protein
VSFGHDGTITINEAIVNKTVRTAPRSGDIGKGEVTGEENGVALSPILLERRQDYGEYW